MTKARTRKAQKQVQRLTEVQIGQIIDVYFEEGYEQALKEFNLSRDVLDYILSDVA